MGDEINVRSSSNSNALKSESSVFVKSFKKASTILKSIGGMNNEESESNDLKSVQKSVSVLASDKSETLSHVTQSKSGERISLKNQNQTTQSDLKPPNTFLNKKVTTKFMRKFPELFRDDVSINPSYTGLRNFPYNVVCRQRFHKNKSKINRQLNKEIENITMTQTVALDGVRVGRIFSVGFPTGKTIVKDFATSGERRRLNRMLDET